MEKMIILSVIMVFISATFFLDYLLEKRKWNGGKCRSCGSRMELMYVCSPARGDNGSKTYMCPDHKCGRTIIFIGTCDLQYEDANDQGSEGEDKP